LLPRKCVIGSKEWSGFGLSWRPAGAIVTEHKFKIGRLVLFHPKAKGLTQLDAARGIYHVIRRMPPSEDGEFQYEIRSEREGHNRVAKE
jgi:hypothetical protein